MSGFVEKIFDSFANKDKHGDQSLQQQQQQYNDTYSQQPSYAQQSYGLQQQQQQQLPPPWVARWDDRDQRYFYLNEQTGERSWTPPNQGYGGAYGGAQEGYQQQQQQHGQYGGEQEEKKEKGHGSAAAWGIGGAALGLGAGALLMHEGEEMSMS